MFHFSVTSQYFFQTKNRKNRQANKKYVETESYHQQLFIKVGCIFIVCLLLLDQISGHVIFFLERAAARFNGKEK